jgi:hypothetical protein
VTEQQPYEVLERGDGYELRRYPPHVVAEVELDGSFEGVGNRAFRPLFQYITGQNRSRQSVAMTAPVVPGAAAENVAMTAPVVQREGESGRFAVAFVLPASMTVDTAPEPTDPEVRVKAVPERVAAVARYSGRWSRSSYEQHHARLLEALAPAGWVPVGPPRFARFNPPFTPWFLRRNEVVQDVRPRA